MERPMRSSSIPLMTSTSTPRVTTKDQFAEFRARLLDNESEYRRAIEDAKQSYSLMYDDEAKIASLLDNITSEYASKEMDIYADELAIGGAWVGEFGGSSHLAPDIVTLIQTTRMLLERVRLLEKRFDEKTSV
jgi:hypothetical protein